MKKKISVDEFFAGADFEAVQQEEPEGHHVTLSHPRFDLWRVIRIAAVVLIFLLFFCFLMKQYTYVYPSHDDYGYASIHYHHTAKGATGMDFTMDQISEYLSIHYNTWGGRVLAFFQEILLFQGGLGTVQVFHTVALLGIFLCLFFLGSHEAKTKLRWVIALAACAMFGLLGKNMAITGLYWYSASVAYMIPVLYLFLGAWLLWLLMNDQVERLFSVSKIFMLPFACVLFFFAGFSMEQVGAFAVVTAGTIIVLAFFRRRNPLMLLYGAPALACAMYGYNFMLVAEGNNSRKGVYVDYYALPFLDQVKTSAETIVNTVFARKDNFFAYLILFGCIVLAAYVIWKKRNVLAAVLNIIPTLMSVLLLVKTNLPYMAALYWIYMVLITLQVTYFLLSSGKKFDQLIWALYLGGIASQAACLVSPIFPERCVLCFAFTWMLLCVRVIAGIAEEVENKKLLVSIPAMTVVILPIILFGCIGAGTIFYGFQRNAAVQEYNKERLELVATKYRMLGISDQNIPLMKIPNDTYAGSTQPYERDLIKDWMKEYYGLPATLEYDDFAYADYDAEQLKELQKQLQTDQKQVQEWIKQVYNGKNT